MREKRAYEFEEPRLRPHWRMPGHRVHDDEGPAGGILRRLRRLLDTLRHFRIRERLVNEHCPLERYPGHHPMQGKHTRHQWCHPPRVVGANNPRPLYAPTLQSMEGGEKVGDMFLVFGLDAPAPRLWNVHNKTSSVLR